MYYHIPSAVHLYYNTKKTLSFAQVVFNPPITCPLCRSASIWRRPFKWCVVYLATRACLSQCPSLITKRHLVNIPIFKAIFIAAIPASRKLLVSTKINRLQPLPVDVTETISRTYALRPFILSGRKRTKKNENLLIWYVTYQSEEVSKPCTKSERPRSRFEKSFCAQNIQYELIYWRD